MILKNCRALDHQKKIPALYLLREEQLESWNFIVHEFCMCTKDILSSEKSTLS